MARKLTYNELEHLVNELERDLLECKNAKESAFRTKEQLERMFNAVPDHIVIIDSHYKIQLANKSLAARIGCPQVGLVGELCYKYICWADRPPSSCPHTQMLNDGKERLVETFNKQFGTNLLITSSPLYDDEGGLFGGVHVFHDIKARKENEETLQELEEKWGKKSDVH